MTRILIADDHPLFREALIGALTPCFNDVVVAEAGSLDAVMAILETEQSFDLILLDLNMPGGEFFQGVIRLTQQFPSLPVAVVSASEGADVVAQVLSLGAKAYIPKSTPTKQIAEAIQIVAEGGRWVPAELAASIDQVTEELGDLLQRFRELTPKQLQVLHYLKAGMMNKQIAEEMHVTEATVKAHISAVLKKLDIKTRTQAVLLMGKVEV